MHRIIVDANIVLKWIPGKNEEKVVEAREIYKMMMKNKLEIYAPTILLVEVLNILVNKRKTDQMVVKKIIKELIETKINFIDLSISDIPKIENITYRYKLTSYDAIYLHIAKEKSCKLLTVDRQLLQLSDLTVGINQFLADQS